MARDTLPRIRESALSLFSEHQYETVSVAEICRNAGVSNGVFYRYYRSKDEIFVSLVEEFIDQFEADIQSVDGSDLEERLLNFIVVVTGAAKHYAGQVSMFRESQYRNRRYEDRLREAYVAGLERVFGRPVSEVEYLYLLSGIRFLATRSLYHDISIDAGLIRDLIMHGVFPGRPGSISLPVAEAPERPAAEGARDRLLESAISLIGSQGFHAVQVVDIARDAGYSVGTFYNHFESKDTCLGAIVEEIGHRTRQYLAERVVPGTSRWESEVLGIWWFLHYFGRHREYYGIVREAEFVAPKAVRDYYNSFETGYRKNLVDLPVERRSLVANFLMGISHYFGIEVIFAGRIEDADGAIRELGQLLRTGISE